MKKKIRWIIWLGLTVALIVIAAKAPRVSAEESPTYTVQLTAEQTLALYGQSFSALYYNGSQVQNVTFTFDKSTRTICDNLNSLFTIFNYNNTDYSILPSNAKNAFTMFASDNAPISQFFNNCLLSNSSWLGVDGSSIIDRNKIVDYEFLLYECEGVSPRPVNSSSYDFQFNIPLSVSLSGVESLKTLFMFQIGMFSADNAFRNSSVVIPNANLRSEVRLYGTNQLIPIDVTSDTFAWNGGTDTSKFGLSMHPINTCDPSFVSPVIPTVSTIDSRTSQFGIFSMDILDSVISGSDITGINWNVRAGDAQFKFLKQDFDPYYSDVNDPNSANYQYQDDTIYLMLMCPIIQGDFTIGRPSGSGSYIDYTESLDKLISGSDATNNKLDIIIQKLDRIYNQMVSDNGGVDLIAPETIGFTQQQKQQILTGVNGMNGEMSEITPADFDDEAETVSGFWDVWENILDIFPPKLLFLYTFALVAGAVSWVIFSRRG